MSASEDSLMRFLCGDKAAEIYANYRQSIHDVKNKLYVIELEKLKLGVRKPREMQIKKT